MFVVKHHRYCHLCHAILPCVLGLWVGRAWRGQFGMFSIFSSVIATEIGIYWAPYDQVSHRKIFSNFFWIDTIQFGHRIEIKISKFVPFDVHGNFLSRQGKLLTQSLTQKQYVSMSGFLVLSFILTRMSVVWHTNRKQHQKEKGRQWSHIISPLDGIVWWQNEIFVECL